MSISTGIVCAQNSEEPPAAPAEGETRPTIGQPHEVTFDAARFFTTRDGKTLKLPVEDDAFLFAIFGDRNGGPAAGIEVLKQAVADANLLEPDLVMTVGDLVAGYTGHMQWMRQMKEYTSVMDGLLMPWFPVAGNHDVYWRGQGIKPKGENEADYETHFGPLWYAFEHKNCWFISLYSDEGNPITGEKNFNKPGCQRMSPAQFAWLEETLEKAKDADHVFAFLHHPRWRKGNYGQDWDRVHALLAQAGNVSAVFAGHIHRMYYAGPKDGIEYITLATVGGAQSSTVPDAGYLHEFHLVMVRQDQIAVAAVPVGEVMDPRSVTEQVSRESARLAAVRPRFGERVMLDAWGDVNQEVTAVVANPVSQPIEVTITPGSADSRWAFTPTHVHTTIEPGATYEAVVYAMRADHELDATFRPAELTLNIDYLAGGRRFRIPETRTDIPMRPLLERPAMPDGEMVAQLNGRNDVFLVGNDLFELPDGPMTLECRFTADSFGDRTGLLAKTEGSEYGFFVNGGVPSFSIFLGSSYAEVKADAPVLKANQWYHIAGVYDGTEVRLYLDGHLIKSVQRSGPRNPNPFALAIGADVDPAGRPTSHFAGQIDSVRLSRVARYSGETCTVEDRFESDADTVLLYNMDALQARWLYDESTTQAPALARGRPIVTERK
ncbi:MAG: hypothetical protein HND57_02675 [Planctomycetes bacterium]|nr:hypothetical protein [Planctomycetota bacterium]